VLGPPVGSVVDAVSSMRSGHLDPSRPSLHRDRRSVTRRWGGARAPNSEARRDKSIAFTVFGEGELLEVVLPTIELRSVDAKGAPSSAGLVYKRICR
jgi:hypothetical protein